ncbi:hypothetical protein ACIA8O_25445 [Kitasatospora sp. NPDC051853]|uniref:hypothetical protein n=1 Tax=Kitasatospora sp. NPDC051853 TaxID=3364058 RepID=UPI00379CD033
MSTVVRRSIAAAATVVVAAATGVATNVATDDAGTGWWVALGMLVVLGVALQVYLTVSSSDGGGTDVTAAGAGSVAIGGSLRGSVKTKASGASGSAGAAPAQGGITAAGPGSVAVGKDVDGPIETDVTP